MDDWTINTKVQTSNKNTTLLIINFQTTTYCGEANHE